MKHASQTDDTFLASHVTASNRLVTRTQRAVRERTITTEERRQRGRRGLGIAVLIVSMLLLALAPAMWVGYDWFAEWESLADAMPQSVYILLCLLPVAFMLGIIGWRQRNQHDNESRT